MSLVGQFILLCGDLELRLLQLHWNLVCCGLSYDKALKSMTIGKKLVALRQQAAGANLTPDLSARVARVLGDVSNVNHTRTLVAHSPLSMTLNMARDGELTMTSSIRSQKDETAMSLGELRKAVTEARKVNDELGDIVSALAYYSVTLAHG